jgi:hypothetical protein
MVRAISYKKRCSEWYILEIDGMNLQAKIAASMSHDTNLCKLFREGGDFHTHNAYHIMAKNQLFDRCTVTFQSGKVDIQMEYEDCKVRRNGKEIHTYYNELEKGDVFPDGEIVSFVSKVGELISYEEYCKNAKKGKCKDLRQIGKMCFVAGTQVLTTNGWINIEELSRTGIVDEWVEYFGDVKIIGRDNVPKEIFGTIETSEKDIVNFTLENGETLSVSNDHVVLVVRDGVEVRILASEVVEGDDLVDFLYSIEL